MSAEILVIQGTDNRIPIHYKNPDGSPRNLSTLAGYAVVISDLKGNAVLKWSKNPITGYGSFTETDAANGAFYFDITAAQSSALAEGYYYFELKEQTTVSGNPWLQASVRAKIVHVVPSTFNGLLALA
jgi:hypothetical protein